ncbi:AurF N-oxygenase family protein [Nocardioides stalactiti]|uniref:AurF N-oxygenase family protein n=1 Tax=Nocardioides stalactiti TaxID=2755356 RepID=UPI0016005D34|nr:diiron oxygenase [Nocardioides stalactiti]
MTLDEALNTKVTRENYDDVLRTLSQASVDRHFDAFADIPWDAEDFQVRHDDPRWVLPAAVDPLGGHQWYISQPLDRQIEIGLWRQANILKVGLQFENVLIRAIMQYVFALPNGSIEYRYLMHEATEECHHTQMFQEVVNRIGAEVDGMPWVLRKLAPVLPMLVTKYPVVFFLGVLAGEEPIDHTQKSIFRAGAELPPVLARVMEIHIAEEARHIAFAHEAVRLRAPHLSRRARHITAALLPLLMRLLGDAILVPPKDFRERFDIPKEVIKELYWDAPESQARLRDLFADVRMLAEDTGLMTPLSRRLWRWCKIDGRPSRFRSEPSVVFRKAA